MKTIPKILVISDYRTTLTVRPEAEIFISLAQQSLDITIMTYAECAYNKKFKAAGIKIISFHPEKKLNRNEILFIRNEIIKGKYNILHLFNSKAILNGIQAAKKLPIKIILYRGSAGHIHWYDPTAYLKYLHPSVNKIVCNSQGVEDYFHQQLFFDKTKTIVINKGHDLKWVEDIQEKDLSEIGIPEDAIKVIYVANNRKVKGVNYLLNAFKFLPINANIHLILIGNNMDNDENKEIIKETSFSKNIHTFGYMPKPLTYVKACDVVILTSIERESLTKSILEGMLLGKTPIITNLPGNKELVTHEENGLVIPIKNPKAIADAILTLNNNRALLKKFGENSKKKMQTDLNINNTISKIKQLYYSLI